MHQPEAELTKLAVADQPGSGIALGANTALGPGPAPGLEPARALGPEPGLGRALEPGPEHVLALELVAVVVVAAARS